LSTSALISAALYVDMLLLYEPSVYKYSP